MKKIILFFSAVIAIDAAQAQTSLMNVKTWAYQLQGMNITQIAADTSFKLIVIDYSSDGTDEYKFTPSQIAQIRSSGKYAISYISIGEAEDYRYYWQSSWSTTPPSWLGEENPDWPGNYKVKFWDPQWQNIILSYIDTIASQGFDGIYMDIIDAYYYWQVENPQQPVADTLMMDFVNKIRKHVNTVTGNTNFIMIPQNAEDIINSTNTTAAQRNRYFNSVNAVGVEDVFCYGNLDEDNPFSPDTYRIGQLQQWLSSSKQVFSIEYLTQTALINQYIVGAHSNNFVPYVCVRALDQLCAGIPQNIEEIKIDKEKLSFPNPSDGMVYLNKKYLDSSSEIYLISATGQLIKKIDPSALKSSGESYLLDLTSVSDGVCYLSVISANKNQMLRLVLIH
jgi:cysteinyl-tRNA synthetase, unknown class